MISDQEKTGSYPVVSTKTASHFIWGKNCDGWWLKKEGSFTVILETIPMGSAEIKHFHNKVEQFFYVLEGVLSIELESSVYHLNQNEGMTIIPGIVHKVFNQYDELAKFLVISCPDSHEDRVNIEE